MANNYNIYKITNNINNKIYIGSTSKTLVKRFKEHLYNAIFNTSIKLYIHMRNLRFENFNIELICERFTSNSTYLEQCEIIKCDDDILLNTIAADATAKLTSYKKERNYTIKLVKQTFIDNNLLSEEHWNINLITFNSPKNYYVKLLKNIYKIFIDGRLSFY